MTVGKGKGASTTDINCDHGSGATYTDCAELNETCGIPLTGEVPDTDPKRRLLLSAVVSCQAIGISGKTTFVHNGRYMELFLTRNVDDSTLPASYGCSGAACEAVLMELIGPVLYAQSGAGTIGAGLEVGGHVSVRLVD